MSNLVLYGLQYWKQYGTRNLIGAGARYLGQRFPDNSRGMTDLASPCYDVTDEELRKHRVILESWAKGNHDEIHSINWFIPDFINAYGGGHFNIFRFANYFANLGIDNRIVIYNLTSGTEKEKEAELSKLFPQGHLTVISRPGIESDIEAHIPYADISFGTCWQSVYYLVKFNNTRGKFYFLQDYEPLFYPGGATSALAEATYKWGIPAVTFGQWLSRMYTDVYHTTCQDFIPCPDEVFSPGKVSCKARKIFFFSRPISERRGFDLGIVALHKLFLKHPEVEIVMAGSIGIPLSRYQIPFPYRDLGSLTIQETAELYRTCDIGLCFSMTNLSFLPLELMASGCPVVTNYGPTTNWLLTDSLNCLMAEPYPSAVVSKLEQALTSFPLRQQLVEGGLALVRKTSWPKEFSRVHKFIRSGVYQS
jgi:glycosyltransferase involved in cell wall biosynthesis